MHSKLKPAVPVRLVGHSKQDQIMSITSHVCLRDCIHGNISITTKLTDDYED